MDTELNTTTDTTLAEAEPFHLGAIIEASLAHKLTDSTRAMYRRDVQAYETFARSSDLPPLDVRTFEAWRDDMVLNSPKSPNTINRMMSAVKTTVKKAQQQGALSENMAGRFEKTEGVELKALKSRLKQHNRTRISPEDMRKLCEAPDPHTLTGKRDRALLAFLASSGARASEAASLTIGQIEPRGKNYIVHLQGKTDVEYREAHLSQTAYQLIMDWIAARPILCQPIFTSFTGRGGRCNEKAITEVAVWQLVQKYAKQCGLDHLKPHDFRRFLGTQLAKKDIRIAQRALGHKDISVTAKHYVLDALEPGETNNLY